MPVYGISHLESIWGTMEEMDILQIVTVLGVILVSMTIHEAMHGFMAYYLGDDTAKLQGRLTLNPIKHIDPFLTILLPIILLFLGGPIFGGAKPVPFNPARVRHGEWGSALVALAGPMVNLLFAFVAFGVFALVDPTPGSGLFTVLYMSVYVNLGFFVFNMLPIPPLDGSRVLYAIAPDGVRRGMLAIEQFGIIGIFLIVMLGQSLIFSIMSGAISGIVGVFEAIFSVF